MDEMPIGTTTNLITRREALALTGAAALAALVGPARPASLTTAPTDALAQCLTAATVARRERGNLARALAFLASVLAALRQERGRAGLTGARAELLLAGLDLRIQIALDHRQPRIVATLLAEADMTVALLPAPARTGWRARLAHARGRQFHNRHRFAQAVYVYRSAAAVGPTGTLLRDLGSALRRLGAEAPARDHLERAARWWWQASDPFQAARCESLLAGLDLEAGCRGTRPALVDSSLMRLLALEQREPRLSPTGNPLAFVQHRLNLLPGLAVVDRRGAEAVVRDCDRVIRACAYARQGFELNAAAAAASLCSSPGPATT